MLDTRFPRFKGDVGNQQTWPFDVVLRVVKGANADAVVGATASQNLAPFIATALELQAEGVNGLTTSCGFLSLAQKQIAAQLDIPFIASALVQVPWVQAMLPENQRVGVLTIDATALGAEHLKAAGITWEVPIAGCEHGQEFSRCILGNAISMDRTLCERDNVAAARQLQQANPDLGAIVLECTNMAPYAAAIAKATGLPVYSIYTLICWMQSGLAHRSFGQD